MNPSTVAQYPHIEASGRAFGIDAVDLPRLERVLRSSGSAFRRRVLTATERGWCDGPTALVRTAICWGTKEAVVKAAGGRWPGFRWTSTQVAPRIDAPDPLLGELVAAFDHQLPACWDYHSFTTRSCPQLSSGSAAACHNGDIVVVLVVARS